MPASSPASRRRLSRAAEFDAVYRRGRSASSRHLVVYVFDRPPDDSRDSRFGFSVSRKVGGAVERNRLKRLLRESSRVVGATLGPGSDVVAVARPGLAEAAESKGLAWLTEEFSTLARRAEASS